MTSPTAAEFKVLGPLQVEAMGRPVPLGGHQQRLVLALLVIEANRVVSSDRLMDALWGDEPPSSAKGSLQAYVSRLRNVVGSDRLVAQSPGYLLHAAPDEVDAARFERAVVEAHRRLGDDPKAAKTQLDAALALWRGPVLGDLDGAPTIQPEVARLEELRASALEDRAEADLALGHHGEAIPELERLLVEHPLREKLWGSLMLGLYRAGRQADALRAYQRARVLLRDELGIDPSPDLQRLHERILKQDPDLELRGRRLRGYELIERIGEGAFGVVHRAYQAGVGRDVAIKVIHRRLANDPEFVRRFEQEARMIARLEHPHIVPLYDYWREPDGAYLAMRFLRGGSLKDRLAARGPAKGETALAVIEQIASALSAAHRQGVIHRDVRPANILFDEDDNAYLSDFGIAKEVATTGVLNRREGGLVYYLAPEEIREQAISPATDVYSLGIVLYEMLAGEHPFGDTPPSEIRDSQLNAVIPAIDRVRPDLPPSVNGVIERATVKEAHQRFVDARELAAALRGALTGAVSVRAGDRPTPAVGVRNPYKGLRAFEEADARDFFGRSTLTSELVARMSDSNQEGRFLAVVGPSGSGKSSVVRAGLVPALRAGGVPGSDRWFYVEMHPGGQAFDELERALLEIAVRRPVSLRDELQRDSRGLVRAADWVLPEDGSELLLVIDQFEELFTLTADEQLRLAFLDRLVTAVGEPGSRIRVVLTLRADYYDRPLLYRAFGDLLGRRTHAVTPLNEDEIEQAVIEPAKAVGLSVDPLMLADIRAQILDQPGALPLLQYVLTELFERRTDTALTRESYRAVGGVLGALGRRADDLYQSFDESGRAATRQLFLRLVALSDDDSTATRRRVSRRDLESLDLDREALDRAIELYGGHRLLSFDRDPTSRAPTVEVAHEALLREWPRLSDWIDEARDELRSQERLADEAVQWEGHGRDPSFLLRGSRLDQAETLSARASIAFTQAEADYVESSRAARAEESAALQAREAHEAQLQRRSLNRLRALVAVLVVGTVIAGGIGWVAQRESRISAGRALAGQSAAAINQDVERSLRLALESADITLATDGTVLRETEEVMHAALQAHRLLLTVPGRMARFSADGQELLLAGPGGGAVFEVRDGSTGEVLTRRNLGPASDPQFPGQIVGYSSDGELFVAQQRENGLDFTAGYETATGKRIWQIPRCCNSIVVSADDGWFTMWEKDNETGQETRLYDLRTGIQSNTFLAVGEFAFAPEGERAVVAKDFWSSERDEPVAGYVGHVHQPGGGATVELRGSGAELAYADWSPDGSTIATATRSTVTLWDPATGSLRYTFGPRRDGITSIRFSADSSRIATGLSNGTTVIWELRPTGAVETLTLAGHAGPVTMVSFDLGGARLVTSGADGVAKLWDLSPLRNGEWLTVPGTGDVAYSHDDRLLATGLENGDVVLYDAQSGAVLRVLTGRGGMVDSLEFTRDDATLVSSGDGIGRVWDVTSGAQLRLIYVDGSTLRAIRVSPDGLNIALAEVGPTFESSGAMLGLLAVGGSLARIPAQLTDIYPPNIAFDFSPDGATLAGAGFSSLHIWSVSEARQVRAIVQWGTNDLAWSADGKRLVAVGSSGEGSITSWDPMTGAKLESLPGTIGEVTDVAFSRDGTRMATSSDDGTIRLWHGDRLEQIMILATDAKGSLAFTTDGTRLAYTAADGMVRVLALRTSDLVELARSRLAGVR